MSRYVGAVCKICRREGMKLFLKGERCFTDKCAMEQRDYPPGQHGQGRIRTSEYRIQLREKQKVRYSYGVSEKQLRRYYQLAKRRKGVTGDYMLSLLERRLDNIVYRLGFAASRAQARQLITHGHIIVNGHKTDIPSVLVNVGDHVEIKEKSRKLDIINQALENREQRGTLDWLEVDREAMKGHVKALPERKDMSMSIQETLIVEYYSK
ncbi:MAG TPA: 30S ribosomal protein S4 [Deltaproteobacteria bacterium]|nr:30S ribosomal protein S4 [Desulfomonilia bacterium]HDP24223.1 30S ribosomal protein S4 [Deltaproteobacteria bacterium]